MSTELKPMTVFVEGGDAIERDMIGDMFSQTLIDNGFLNVTLLNVNGETVPNDNNDMVSILDAVTSIRPQLFKTPMVIRTSVPVQVDVLSATMEAQAILRDTALKGIIKTADTVMVKAVEAVREVLGDQDPESPKVDKFLRKYSAAEEEGHHRSA